MDRKAGSADQSTAGGLSLRMGPDRSMVKITKVKVIAHKSAGVRNKAEFSLYPRNGMVLRWTNGQSLVENQAPTAIS